MNIIFKKNMRKNYIGVLLYAVLLFIFFRSYDSNLTRGFIDQDFLGLNPRNVLGYFFSWGDRRSFGEYQSIVNLNMLNGLVLFFLNVIGLSVNVSVEIVTLLMFALLPVGFYLSLKIISEYLLKTKETNNVLWIFSFLPVFTLFYFNDEWHYVFGQRLAWLVALFIFYFLNKYLFTKKGLLGVIISVVISNFAFNLFPFFLVFHIFFLFYFSVLLYLKKVSFKKVFLLYSFYILLTICSSCSVILVYLNQDLATSSTLAYAKNLRTYVSVNDYVSNLFRGVSILVWNTKIAWDHFQDAIPYQSFFTKQSWVAIILYAPLLLCVWLLTFTRKNIWKTFFLIIMLASLFVAKASNPPFGNIFEIILNNFSIANMYRSPANKWMPLFYTALTFLTFTGFVLANKTMKKVACYVLVFYYLFFGAVISYYGIYSSGNFFNLPLYYKELQDYFSDKSANRVLFLPERDYGKKYEFGAYDNSIDFYNLSSTTFDIGQTLGNSTNFKLSSKLLDSVNFFDPKVARNKSDIYSRGYDIKRCGYVSPESISLANKLLYNSKINYIVFRNDLAGRFDENIINSCEISTYKYLLKEISFNKIGEFGRLDIYKNNIYQKGWFNFKNNYTFEKINPTEYIVNLNIKEGPDTLEFVSSYSKGWKLYLNSINRDGNYDFLNFFKNIKFIFEKPLTENVFDEAKQTNVWTIDAKLIKNVANSNFYASNNDGSLNIEVIMYYQPQAYLSLCLTISGLTLAGLLSYLGYDFFNRRRKNKLKKI